MTEGPIDDPKTVEDVRKEPIRLAAGQERNPFIDHEMKHLSVCDMQIRMVHMRCPRRANSRGGKANAPPPTLSQRDLSEYGSAPDLQTAHLQLCRR